MTLNGFNFLFLVILSAAHIATSLVDVPIVVAGAGPASLMFTLRYLQLNPEAKVEIYERYSKPPRYKDSPNECISGDYAFGMGVSARPRRTLDKIPGLERAVENIAQPTLMRPGMPPIWLVNRRELCAEMIHKLEEEHGIEGNGRLKIYFDSAVEGIKCYDDDAPQRYCAVVQEKGSPNSRLVPYSFLIGADGTHSAVRSSLVRLGLLKGKRYTHGTTWKALQLPAQPQLQGDIRAPDYRTKDDSLRLLPRYKDRFVLLSFRGKKQSSVSSNPFNATSPQDLRNSLRNALPNVTEFPSDDVLETYLNQPGRDSWYMTLDRHYVPKLRTILIGDAAVGMYTSLGQGCVYAMERASFLAEELAIVPETDFTSTLDRVAKSNEKEGKAIADLNLISHLMRVPLVRNVGMPRMLKLLMALSDGTTDPYSVMAKRDRWTILLSRPFWMRVRTRTSLDGTGKE